LNRSGSAELIAPTAPDSPLVPAKLAVVSGRQTKIQLNQFADADGRADPSCVDYGNPGLVAIPEPHETD